MTRRSLLLGAAASAIRAQPKVLPLDPNTLPKFVDPLPIPPIATTQGGRYRLRMSEFRAKVHRDLPPTVQWGFNGMSPGPTIRARRGRPLSVEWLNGLPTKHLLPIDHTLHGAERDKPDVRGIVHIHGAKTRPEDDGYPERWYVPGKSVTYRYPNDQEPATLWYHDHTMGINRLNIYAGLFGFYVIGDEYEDKLGLPSGAYDIPLALYDRSLLRDGSLDYPTSGMLDRPWVPEAFGEAMLVNGKLSPYLDVEPRLYRFRILNASNGRFFHLSLSSGQPFHQIGTEQGLLPSALDVSDFVAAPAERVDILIDFRGHDGDKVVLRSESFELLQFRVGKAARGGGPADVPKSLRPVPVMPESSAVKVRRIPIVEDKAPNGDSMMMMLGGMHWSMPVTENPKLDDVEVWEFVNLTEDSHPLHLHLVRFQILDRRPFDEDYFFATRRIRFTGPVEPPEPYEAGWKDTVRAHAKTITRIIVKFEGYVGRYVWHCHLLEHEDNEMMRPFDVLPKAAR